MKRFAFPFLICLSLVFTGCGKTDENNETKPLSHENNIVTENTEEKVPETLEAVVKTEEEKEEPPVTGGNFTNEEMGITFDLMESLYLEKETPDLLRFTWYDIDYCAGIPDCIPPHLLIKKSSMSSVDEYIESINQVDTNGNDTVIVTMDTPIKEQEARWGKMPAMASTVFVAVEHPGGYVLEFSITGLGINSDDFSDLGFRTMIDSLEFLQ